MPRPTIPSARASATIRRPGAPETSRTKTVLEFIEVFAVDRVRESEGSDSSKGAKAENLSVLIIPASFKAAVPFMILILVLYFRPQGFLGVKEKR